MAIVIKAQKAGTARVRVTSTADPNVSGTVDVTVTDANLFPELPEQSGSGVTLTPAGDREWTVDGTVTAPYNFGTTAKLAAGSYRLSGDIGADKITVDVRKPAGGWWSVKQGSQPVEFTVDAEYEARMQISLTTAGTVFDNTSVSVSLVKTV